MESLGFTANGLAQIAFYLVALLALSVPLGRYMAAVYLGRAPHAQQWLGALEHGIYRLCGMDVQREMHWSEYARAVLAFSAGGFVLLFLLLNFQHLLPLNPRGLPGLDADLAFNTAVSFVTNTNWQSYSGEMVMSLFSQMVGLAVQNFLSAAVGMAVLVALLRGLVRRESSTIGNFWQDMVRSILYILLPLSILYAGLLVAQGVPQTLQASREVTLLETQGDVVMQSLPLGPVASQVAIKQLGTNGGGFYNVNSAHPLENPTPISNFLEMLALLLIPAALCVTFGQMVGDRRQGRALYTTMLLIFVPFLLFCYAQEQLGGVLPGGNMEGKEVRFGVANSALWATATTAASNGSVNAMHDSFTPLGGMVPLMLMQLGEVVFGGVGSGLYGMLAFVLIAVFISGLMVGRTPEYLGKKIQAFEIKMAALVILVPALATLVGTALGVATEAGNAGPLNKGMHGFSEILYAFTSAANNNGSAFAGLTADTVFYNTLLGLAMLLGRFWVMLPMLAIAGSLAAKKTAPESAGTLPTHTLLFVFVLSGIVLMVGLLTYVPALALGPIAEHLMLGK